MSQWLITSDLHLSDRPKDSYRFGLFDWLVKQQHKYKVDATFILGDLTDRKDNHSSALVNRVIDELLKLRPPVYILRGNHDGLDPANPFFRFLQTIEGLDFVVEPMVLGQGYADQPRVALIPHQVDQPAFDRACGIVGHKMPGVMMHQTIQGAVAETGMPLSGLQASLVEARQPLVWLSGDIHRPQTLNCGLTYVGAPYRIKHGDDFTPRVLLIKGDQENDLYFPCLKKHILRVRGAKELKLTDDVRPGDHIKIIIELKKEDIVTWVTQRALAIKICKDLGLEVYGCDLEVLDSKTPLRDTVSLQARTPKEIVLAFCKAEGLPSQITDTGLELMNE